MTINLINGNAKHLPLASRSVQCCVTSPPYWGLRAYLSDDDPNKQYELGLEPVPDCLGWATGAPCGECYVCHMVAVFREVRRVLRDDATCWLNLGDSYAQDGKWGGASGSKNYTSAAGGLPRQKRTSGFKDKDLIGIPWRVAFALQADGWWLRSDIIWAKPNPMPESVTDRPTKAHEYVFLLAKSSRYYYDAEAIKEQAAVGWNNSSFTDERDQLTKPGLGMKPRGGGFSRKYAEQQPAHGAMRLERPADNGTRNRRTVWNIATQAYSGAHFATFPEKLVEPCLLAGTSERGCCPHCGAPWARVVEKGYRAPAEEAVIANMIAKGVPRQKANLYGSPSRDPKLYAANPDVTTGWSPTCACPPHEPRPCLVLDPFSGSGTVGRVAAKHRRRFVGTDLNPEYIALAGERTSNVQIMLGVSA